MRISFPRNKFLSNIFPDIDINSDDQVISAFKKYFSLEGVEPVVTVTENEVIIEPPANALVGNIREFNRAAELCSKKRFDEAKIILESLIQQYPLISEYHRTLAQAYEEEGDHEKAIDILIDALRCDPKNNWALLLMGNIYSRYKNDLETARKYFDQALEANPKDTITINNIGANLIQQGNLEEAKKYFWEAVRINDSYPNTHFALGMIAEMEGDLHTAFYSTIKAIKTNKQKDGLYQTSVKQAFDVVKRVVSSEDGKKKFQDYRRRLELECGKEIKIIQDDTIPTAAKLEIAENHKREEHIVKFKPSYPAYEHLIMHELVHLDFIIQARTTKTNLLFISKSNLKSEFIKSLEPTIKKLKGHGIPENQITDYCNGLFEGLNRQVFNAPIDLFIEEYLFLEFPDFRPFQFLSLHNLLMENLKAVTEKKYIELSPKDVVSISKTYNLVNAFQFRDLFGIDMISEFRASPLELKQANSFYDEYLQYKDDKEPGEEYELILNWARDLKLDKYFELVNENKYRNKGTEIDEILKSIEEDPFDLEKNDSFKKEETNKFLDHQKESGVNMFIVMFMVEAIEFFQDKPIEEIKEIAFEIALLGTHGYHPLKKDYRLSSLPGKTFSGYHILSYYYVSWALALPEMLISLQLPYGEEYDMAKSFIKP
jgi:tetratricopeptide (TPR) repeat protein